MEDNLFPFHLSFFNFLIGTVVAVQLINNIRTVKKRGIVCLTGLEEGSKVLAIEKLILVA